MSDIEVDLSPNERLKKMKAMLENMEAKLPRRGSRAQLYPPDYVRLYHRTDKLCRELDVREAGETHPMELTRNQKMFSSKTPFSKLDPTALRFLKYDESAKGNYIIVRIMEDWNSYSVAFRSNVIEDERGHVARFYLYNYPLEEPIYPGDVITIKEPYLWCNDEIPTISCNCPTNIAVIRHSHRLYPGVQGIKWRNDVKVNDSLAYLSSKTASWLERGNKLYKNGEIILSREAYAIGLTQCSNSDPQAKIFRLNLLAVHNRLRYYEWVVENGGNFLQDFPEEQLGYLHLGKAYYMLRKYKKAYVTYKTLCQQFKDNTEGRAKLEETQERIREANGGYNFDKLRTISLEKSFEKIDCADFCGPVKLTQISGERRGLVLKNDVRAGDLLVVSKALAVVLDPGQELDWNLIKTSVVTQLARQVMKNPMTIGTPVYKLSAGVYYRKKVQLFCDENRENEPISDLNALRHIVRTNVFCIPQTGVGIFQVCGLFLLPSYINHSCTSNVRQEVYNDVMVVTALEDMKGGTELTRENLWPDFSFSEEEESSSSSSEEEESSKKEESSSEEEEEFFMDVEETSCPAA